MDPEYPTTYTEETDTNLAEEIANEEAIESGYLDDYGEEDLSTQERAALLTAWY